MGLPNLPLVLEKLVLERVDERLEWKCWEFVTPTVGDEESV